MSNQQNKPVSQTQRVLNAVKEKKAKPTQTIFDLVKKQGSQFAMALGKTMSPERFTRIALTCIRQNPKLMQCSSPSLLGSLMQCAQLGLEPNTLGQAWLIPYGTECQFQIGYKGLLKLFYNSEKALSIYAKEVYTKDEFEYEFGLDPKLKHIPASSERGELSHFYAIAKMKDGAYAFDVMSVDEMKAHAKKYSKAYSSGPWKTDFVAMGKKTILIRLTNQLPLSIETQRAVEQDSTIKNWDDTIKDMSEQLDITDYSQTDMKEETHNEDGVYPENGEIKMKVPGDKKPTASKKEA